MTSVVFTLHASDVCEERRIAREWVERTIEEPDVLEADRHHPGALNALRSIPERGGRTLR